jgi:hypothetical protein
VRSRLSRGTLQSVKKGGMVYVLLPPDAQQHAARDATDMPGESSLTPRACACPQRRVRAPYVASWAGSAELPVIRLSRYGPARRARASHYFRLWRGVVTSCCDLLRPTSPRLPEKRENCCLILSFGTTLKGLLDPEGVSGAVGLL